MLSNLLQKLGIRLPIIQAPMAGISTAAMAAAVENPGGLGSIGIGNLDAEKAREQIRAIRAETSAPFNVNVFCHQPPRRDAAREAGWLERLRPEFERFGTDPPKGLREIYRSFLVDEAMQEMLLEERPPVVSFHFGLPPRALIDAFHERGVLLFATATSLQEGKAIEAAGIDAVVAQGYEAGGHRGVFDPAARDDRLPTMPLTRLMVRSLGLPVIAAGGIMDGAGIAAALALGAFAAQLGTAFIPCAESAADAAFRALLSQEDAPRTVMTNAISGRPARCIANALSAKGKAAGPEAVADYPLAYDAAKQLHAAASRKGDYRYGPYWAGQGLALSRALPVSKLMAALERELVEAIQNSGSRSL